MSESRFNRVGGRESAPINNAGWLAAGAVHFTPFLPRCSRPSPPSLPPSLPPSFLFGSVPILTRSLTGRTILCKKAPHESRGPNWVWPKCPVGTSTVLHYARTLLQRWRMKEGARDATAAPRRTDGDSTRRNKSFDAANGREREDIRRIPRGDPCRAVGEEGWKRGGCNTHTHTHTHTFMIMNRGPIIVFILSVVDVVVIGG